MRGRTVGGLTFAVLVGGALALAVSTPAVAAVCADDVIVVTDASSAWDSYSELDTAALGYVTAKQVIDGGGAAECAPADEGGGFVSATPPVLGNPPVDNPTEEPTPPDTSVPPSAAPGDSETPVPTDASTPSTPAAVPSTPAPASSSPTASAPTSSGPSSNPPSSTSSSPTSTRITTSASGATTTAPVSIAAAVATAPVLTATETEAASDAIKETRSVLPVTIDPSPVLLSDQASATGSPIVSPNDTGTLAIVVGMSAISIGCAAFSVILRRRSHSRHSI